MAKREAKMRATIEELSSILTDITQAFQRLVAAPAHARGTLLEHIVELELAADDKCEKVIRRVGKTFITPYDREDIYVMVEALDDVADSVEDTSHMVVAYGLGDLPPALVKQIDDLAEMARETAGAVPEVRDSEALLKRVQAIHILERQIKAQHRDLSVDLARWENQIEGRQLRDVADRVERSADCVERVLRALAVIAIKET